MAGVWHFTIEQGATFRRHLEWRDPAGALVPLAGCTARLALKRHPDDPDPPLLDLTTENGGITLTDPGLIDLLVPADATAALDFVSCVHDLTIVDPSAPLTTRLLAGTAWLAPGV